MIATALFSVALSAQPLPQAWMLIGDRELSFVRPDSDDFALTLSCVSQARIDITIPAPLDTPKAIVLASGSSKRGYAAATHREELEITEARASLNDPVLQHFRRTGALAVNGIAVDAASPAEWTAIAAFLRACR